MRHELEDDEWDLIEDLFPRPGYRGRPWKDHRQTLNGMMWVLRTGAPWRDLPMHFGPWQSVYDRFNRWRKSGMFDRILERLQLQLDKQGHIDWTLWCIDGTSIRAAKAAAGAGEKGEPMSPQTMR